MTLNVQMDRAELRNINIGKEGNGDNMPTRLDLKFIFRAKSDILLTLLGIEERHEHVFWENGDVIGGMEEITLNTEWNHNDLRFGAMQDLLEEDSNLVLVVENVTVKNVKLKPQANHLLEVSLTAQFRDPEARQLKQVTDLGKHEAGLTLVFNDDVSEQARKDDADPEQSDIEDSTSTED